MTIIVAEPVEQAPSHAKRKRGFTLTEIAIVLGIIGLILGAIWVAAAAVYNNLRVSHANTEILQVVQGVRALYAQQNNNAGITNTLLISSNAVPTDMITGVAGGLNDPWSGGITTILPSTEPALAGFSITMSNVPPGACINLLTAVGGQTRDPGLYAVAGPVGAVAGIGGTGAITTAGAATTANVTPALANTACGAVPGTVGFGFNLKS